MYINDINIKMLDKAGYLCLSDDIDIISIYNIEEPIRKRLLKGKNVKNDVYVLQQKINIGTPVMIVDSIVVKVLNEYKTPIKASECYKRMLKWGCIDLGEYVKFVDKMIYNDVLEIINNVKENSDSYQFDDKIVDCLGRGRYCNVYKLYDGCMYYVKKIIRKKYQCYGEIYQGALKYLKREYGTVDYLRSQGINSVVEMYDMDYDEGSISMEYVYGKNIEKYSTSINEYEKFCELAVSILRSINQIHELGYLHGDIHYKNIIAKQNNDIKIIDFGFSRKICDSINIKEGAMTPFMTPELAQKKLENSVKNVQNVRSEIYSIGVLLYYIITKKFPFSLIDNLHYNDMLISIIKGRQNKLSSDKCYGDSKIAMQINLMIDKDIEKRPKSLRDVCANCFDIIL